MAAIVKLAAILWLFAATFPLVIPQQQDLFGQRFSLPTNPFFAPPPQSLRITPENLDDVDWMQVDRREEDG